MTTRRLDRELRAMYAVRPGPVERWARAPNRARDRIMLAVCVGYWLLMAALMPPTFPMPIIAIWWLAVSGATWLLWRGYRRLTRPWPQPATLPPQQSEKYAIADDLTRHIDDVVAAAEREAIRTGPRPPSVVS